MATDKNPQVPIEDLRTEQGADELTASLAMEPYLQYAVAVMQGGDVESALNAIAGLPLENRYVWRVASALKWGFADFDDFSVAADRDTLKPEDLTKLMDLLKVRPIQFCMFLTALVGPEAMKAMMINAIVTAEKSA
jgi:hypothetical protein